MTIDLSDYRSKPETSEKTAPDYNYTIKLKDGSERNLTGYLALNSLFVAVCRGEGVIYWMQPFEAVQEIVNNGEAVQAGTLN